jgi:hypothetical protein
VSPVRFFSSNSHTLLHFEFLSTPLWLESTEIPDIVPPLLHYRKGLELCLELRQSLAKRMIKKLGRAVIGHLVAALIFIVLEASDFLPILR